MDYLTDTTFLIDIWRERRRPSAAVQFTRDHEDAVVGLPWVVKGEFLRGAALAGHSEAAVDIFLKTFIVVWPSEMTLRKYASVYAALKRKNALVGPNDLWIAASALELGLPLLTRNPDEFDRIDGLDVVNYGERGLRGES